MLYILKDNNLIHSLIHLPRRNSHLVAVDLEMNQQSPLSTAERLRELIENGQKVLQRCQKIFAQ